jgi:magnesium-transporting ATPase (P-type)
MWDGNLNSSILGKTHSCGIKNLLLRGCTLKNTRHAYGVVLYTGSQTKIMMNSKGAPRKVSKMAQTMNYMLYSVFIFQMAIICLYAGLYLNWMSNNEDVWQYLNMTAKGGSLSYRFVI